MKKKHLYEWFIDTDAYVKSLEEGKKVKEVASSKLVAQEPM